MKTRTSWRARWAALAGTMVAATTFVPQSCVPDDVTAPRLPDTDPRNARQLGGSQTILAQRIRAGAGVPPESVVGVRPGNAPGIPGGVQLTWSPAITIRSRAEAQAIAASGDGTAGNPFRIENLDIDGSGATFAFLWNDPSADYHVLLERCRLGGADDAQIYVRTATGFTLRQAEIGGAGPDAEGIRVLHGDVHVDRVVLDGLGGDGIETLGTDPISLLVTDCLFSEEGGPWRSGSKGVQGAGRNPNQVIRVAWSSFAASTLETGVRTWRDGDWTVENCRFACRNGIRGGIEQVTGVRINSCVFETTQNAIRATLWTDWDVGYCDFLDNEAGYRLALFVECGTGRAHHSRFVKTTGANAGNECLETFDSRDVEFDNNWVEAASEDAFEHVRPRGNCTVHHCVGDAVVGQIVDYFGHHPENGGAVHHIFGNCLDVGVLITDCDRVDVHDIFTDNHAGTWGGVVLEQRHSLAGEHPAGCSVRWPLPSPEVSAQGRPFTVRGEVGPGNAAVWMEHGRIRRYSS